MESHLQDNGSVEGLLEVCTLHENNLQSQTFDHVFLLFPNPVPFQVLRAISH